MGIVQRFLERKRQRKLQEEAYEDDDRVRENVYSKKIPHNERVLRSHLEEERQEAIKEALQWTEKVQKLKDKQKAREFMKFNPTWFNDESNVIKQPFLFGSNSSW